MPTQFHNTVLLITDQQRSVLNVLHEHQPHPIAYTSYGHRQRKNGMLSLLGFNGELSDPLTGCYLLGNGYRAYNPVLMRFNSPDSRSPFNEGGLNAYAYCLGDPVNRSDPTGHAGKFWKAIKTLFKSKNSQVAETSTYAPQMANASTQTEHILPENEWIRVVSRLGEKTVSQKKKIESLQNEMTSILASPHHFGPHDLHNELSRLHKKIETLVIDLNATEARYNRIAPQNIIKRTQRDIEDTYGTAIPTPLSSNPHWTIENPIIQNNDIRKA